MKRTGTPTVWLFYCCTRLLLVVGWTTLAAASTSSLFAAEDAQWSAPGGSGNPIRFGQSSRWTNSSGGDEEFAASEADYNPSAWQSPGSTKKTNNRAGVKRPSAPPAWNGPASGRSGNTSASDSRWLPPTQVGADAAENVASRSSRSRTASAVAQAAREELDDTSPREPREFVPTNAQRLVAPPTNQTTGTARRSPASTASYNRVAHKPTKSAARSGGNKPRTQMSAVDRFRMNVGWIQPAQAVEELPMPQGRFISQGEGPMIEGEMSEGPMSDGEVTMDEGMGDYGTCDTCGPDGCYEGGDGCYEGGEGCYEGGEGCYEGGEGCYEGGEGCYEGGEGYCEPGCECECGCGDGMGGDCACGECCEPSCGYEPSCAAEPRNGCIDLGFGIYDPEACETVCFRVPKVHDLQVFGGVHGFKGPYDLNRDSGNFGFHEGFNAGLKVPMTMFGYQLGYQATHSQLNGDQQTGSADPFTQHFMTAGLFRRNMNGWQAGVAYDVLHDERWGANDFEQVRGEISFVDCGKHELGVSAAMHMSESDPDFQQEFNTTFQATDQYLLFYRLHSCNNGEGRIFGGFNDDDDAIVGADAHLPLHDRWSIQTGFTYLMPDAEAGREGASQEAWNLSINLVWHYKFRAKKYSPFRPLFNVADNGSLIVDDRP